ncbi:putative sugar O-methyltransferase [Litorivicinus sp.]|nr:putative sugar O-methyltransferase [Litorivicinus sp.]
MNDIPKKHHTIRDNSSVFNTLKAGVRPGHELGAGSYWEKKYKVIERSIAKFGLAGIRGDSNYIGTSYADNHYIDVRTFLIVFPFNLLRWLIKLSPISVVFNKQIELTDRYLHEVIDFQKQHILSQPELISLIGKYRFSNISNDDAKDTILLNNESITLSQLRYLDMHLGLADSINFSEIHSVLEVGGGYGAHTDFLIQNFSNIRKFLYVDMFPVLYVGTQYLESIHGDAVKVVTEAQFSSSLLTSPFEDNDSLEIICISPHFLDNVRFKFDLCLSCNAFQEMAIDTVAGYAAIFDEKLSDHGSIGLVNYSEADGLTQTSSDSINSIFSLEFDCVSKRSRFDLTQTYDFLTSKKSTKI